MKCKPLNRDDGSTYGFIVYGISIRTLCRKLAQIAGVFFTERRKFFWSAENVQAFFSLNGHEFKIDSDSWDDALWVIPKDVDATYPEIKDVMDSLIQGTRRIRS